MTHHAHQVLRFHRRIVSNSLKFYVRQIVYPQSCKKSQSTVQRQDGFIPLASMCIKWPGCLSKNPPAFGAWFHAWKDVATSISRMLLFNISGNSMAPNFQERTRSKKALYTGWLLHQTKLSNFEFICTIKDYCCTSATQVLLEAASHGQRKLQIPYIIASDLQILLRLCSLWQSANQWQAGLAVASLSAWWEDSIESTKSFIHLYPASIDIAHVWFGILSGQQSIPGASLCRPLRRESHWKCPRHRTPAIPNTGWSPERQWWGVNRSDHPDGIAVVGGSRLLFSSRMQGFFF